MREKLRAALRRLAKNNIHIQGRIDADIFRLISSCINEGGSPRRREPSWQEIPPELQISVRRLADKLKVKKKMPELRKQAALLVTAINRLPKNFHLSFGADLDDLKRAAQGLMRETDTTLSAIQPKGKKILLRYEAEILDARAVKIFRDYRGGVNPVTWNAWRNKTEGPYQVFLTDIFEALQIEESAASIIKSRVSRNKREKRRHELVGRRERTAPTHEP